MAKYLFLLLFLFIPPALAQSTATPIVAGNLVVVGGQAVWHPYTASNPMPASSQ